MLNNIFKPVCFPLTCSIIIILFVPKNIALPTYATAALPYNIANTLRRTQSDVWRKLNVTRCFLMKNIV